MAQKMCVLDEEQPCVECDECNRCDLDPDKFCDNCMRCLELDDDYLVLPIDEIQIDGDKA
jgi:hypothetical protein